MIKFHGFELSISALFEIKEVISLYVVLMLYGTNGGGILCPVMYGFDSPRCSLIDVYNSY